MYDVYNGISFRGSPSNHEDVTGIFCGYDLLEKSLSCWIVQDLGKVEMEIVVLVHY